MTWKRAADALANRDAIAEAANPFHIPTRIAENASFVSAGLLAAATLWAPIFGPLTTENLAPLIGVAVFAVLLFYRGWRERRYRLARRRAVEELRQQIFNDSDFGRPR